MTLDEMARRNMDARFNDNPHRGVAVGMLEDGSGMQMSWVMGRSSNSQNRVYRVDGGKVFTEAHDPSKMEDPSLIIYNAMQSVGLSAVPWWHVVSNGDQTDTVATRIVHNHLGAVDAFYAALKGRHCEPDGATFTPRISGLMESGSSVAYLSVLKADPFAKAHWVDHAFRLDRKEFASQAAYLDAVDEAAGLNRHEFPTQRQFFEMPLAPGYGWCVQTYDPGSQQLPSFTGEPFLMPMQGDAMDVRAATWMALEPAWRVGLAAKVLPAEGGYDVLDPVNMHEGGL